jgi:hypothetical protein
LPSVQLRQLYVMDLVIETNLEGIDSSKRNYNGTTLLRQYALREIQMKKPEQRPKVTFFSSAAYGKNTGGWFGGLSRCFFQSHCKPRFQAWQRRLCQSKDRNARIHETKLAIRSENSWYDNLFFVKYLNKLTEMQQTSKKQTSFHNKTSKGLSYSLIRERRYTIY